MQYEYTLEEDLPIKVTMTYRELQLLDKLLQKDAAQEWRYDAMRKSVRKTLCSAADFASSFYAYQAEFALNEETDNA